MSFTQSQKDVIKSLVASGDVAAAQTLILEELNHQYGGQAEAAANSGAGRLQQMANSWGDFKEAIGEGLNNAMLAILDSFSDLWAVIKDLFAPIGELLSSFDSLNGEMSIGTILGKAMTWMVKGLTLLLKPLVWIVRGLADAFKWLYDNSELVRTAFDYIKRGVNGIIKVFSHLGGIMSAIGNSFGHLWDAIKTMNFDGLGGKISGEFTKAFETKPVEKFEEAVKKETKTVKEQTKEQIKALEERNKKLKETYENAEKINKNLAAGFGLIDGSDLVVDLSGVEVKNDSLWDFSDMEMPDFDAEMDSQISTVKTKFDKMREMMASSSQAIYDTLENITVQGIATIGAAMGTAMAGGDFGGIILGFAQMIGGAVSSLGQQLIALGVAELAIMDALKTFGASNPGLIIAGGIALTMIGAAMKSNMSSSIGFADGGLVTGSVFANIGEGIGTNSANPEVIAPLDKLKNFINPSQGGGMSGGDVKFRIEGNTLVGILDRQSKNTKYSR